MQRRKTRVLFITYFAANEPLLDSRTTPVLREFLKEGFEYDLVTFEKRVSPGEHSCFYDEGYLKERFGAMGIRWHPLRYHKRPLIISTVYDVCIGVLYGVFIAIKRRADFIHAQTAAGGAIGFLVAKIVNKKFVYDVNGLLAEEYADGGIWDRGSAVFKLVRAFEKQVIYNASGIIILSKGGADIITGGAYLSRRKKNWNFQIIPSHVDMARFRLNTAKDGKLEKKYDLAGKFVLAYVGSVGTWYMLDEMMDFFRVAKQFIPNAVFLIISHCDKGIIEAAAYAKGLGREEVVITEARPDRMPRYLSLADAAIAFIKPVFSKQACSPVKLGEYLASGVPVVINSNVGDTEALIRNTNTGVIIDEFSERAYEAAAKTLKGLIDTDKGLKLRCHKAAKEHLSLDTVMDKYKRLYRDI